MNVLNNMLNRMLSNPNMDMNMFMHAQEEGKFERAAIKENHDAMRLWLVRGEGSNNVEGFFNVATRCCSLVAPLPLSFVVVAAALDVTLRGEGGVATCGSNCCKLHIFMISAM